MEDGLEVLGRGLCGDFFADALGAECGFGIGLDLLNVGVDGQSAAGEGCLVLELVRAPGPEDVVVHRVFVLKNQFKVSYSLCVSGDKAAFLHVVVQQDHVAGPALESCLAVLQAGELLKALTELVCRSGVARGGPWHDVMFESMQEVCSKGDGPAGHWVNVLRVGVVCNDVLLECAEGFVEQELELGLVKDMRFLALGVCRGVQRVCETISIVIYCDIPHAAAVVGPQVGLQGVRPGHEGCLAVTFEAGRVQCRTLKLFFVVHRCNFGGPGLLEKISSRVLREFVDSWYEKGP